MEIVKNSMLPVRQEQVKTAGSRNGQVSIAIS
jgi:hypothetical protein